MTRVLFSLLLLSASIALGANQDSYFYAVVVLSSGKKIMNCERVNGGYQEFVKHINEKFSPLSMRCTDANQHFKAQFNVMCEDGSTSMAHAFWFRSQKDCQEARRKEKTE